MAYAQPESYARNTPRTREPTTARTVGYQEEEGPYPGCSPGTEAVDLGASLGLDLSQGCEQPSLASRLHGTVPSDKDQACDESCQSEADSVSGWDEVEDGKCSRWAATRDYEMTTMEQAGIALVQAYSPHWFWDGPSTVSSGLDYAGPKTKASRMRSHLNAMVRQLNQRPGHARKSNESSDGGPKQEQSADLSARDSSPPARRSPKRVAMSATYQPVSQRRRTSVEVEVVRQQAPSSTPRVQKQERGSHDRDSSLSPFQLRNGAADMDESNCGEKPPAIPCQSPVARCGSSPTPSVATTGRDSQASVACKRIRLAAAATADPNNNGVTIPRYMSPYTIELARTTSDLVQGLSSGVAEPHDQALHSPAATSTKATSAELSSPHVPAPPTAQSSPVRVPSAPPKEVIESRTVEGPSTLRPLSPERQSSQDRATSPSRSVIVRMQLDYAGEISDVSSPGRQTDRGRVRVHAEFSPWAGLQEQKYAPRQRKAVKTQNKKKNKRMRRRGKQTASASQKERLMPTCGKRAVSANKSANRKASQQYLAVTRALTYSAQAQARRRRVGGEHQAWSEASFDAAPSIGDSVVAWSKQLRLSSAKGYPKSQPAVIVSRVRPKLKPAKGDRKKYSETRSRLLSGTIASKYREEHERSRGSAHFRGRSATLDLVQYRYRLEAFGSKPRRVHKSRTMQRRGGARNTGHSGAPSYDPNESHGLLGLVDYAINLQVDLSSSGSESSRLSELDGGNTEASRYSMLLYSAVAPASGAIAALSRLADDLDGEHSTSELSGSPSALHLSADGSLLQAVEQAESVLRASVLVDREQDSQIVTGKAERDGTAHEKGAASAASTGVYGLASPARGGV